MSQYLIGVWKESVESVEFGVDIDMDDNDIDVGGHSDCGETFRINFRSGSSLSKETNSVPGDDVTSNSTTGIFDHDSRDPEEATSVLFGDVTVFTSVQFGRDSEITSKQCGVLQAHCMASLSFKSAFAISHVVSVQAEKFGGDETHPIGLVRGMPINAGSFVREGNMTAKRCVSSGRNHSR